MRMRIRIHIKAEYSNANTNTLPSIHECIREYFNSDYNKITRQLHVISKLFYYVITVVAIIDIPIIRS